ncbi:PTS sugar transporter subunit IIA [Paratractidigestivibacter faecalis]|uniref:PTS sugar transporter subunit IIA n=1 Tax=Paratractidigestivibacter faecalis TaxID=2292441 RepID=UPI000E3D429F|nr:hypothetical protein [Paratractidigestivibacter faecalis]
MRHVIIASHHRFAEGLADTLEFIGGVENMRAVCAYVDETPLEEQVAAAFASVAPDDEVLVLTDILQGSVNQAFAPYVGDHVFLVAGVNVALCLELALSAEPLSVAAIDAAIEQARSAMVLVNTYATEVGEDDE